jgi:predicted DNA-binding transcriptional regulator YafY
MTARKTPDDLAATLSQLPQPDIEAVWLGAMLTARFADDDQAHSARRIFAALEDMRASTLDGKMIVLGPEAEPGTARARAVAHCLDTHALRHALIHELKLSISYTDGKKRATKRIVWPLAVEDYGPQGAMLGWCERREDFRNFRFDRITELAIIQQRFEAPRNVMLAVHEALLKMDAIFSQ